jgi:hypothetical protein
MSKRKQLEQAREAAWQKLKATPEHQAYCSAIGNPSENMSTQNMSLLLGKLAATPEFKAWQAAGQAYKDAKMKSEENND